MSLINRIDALVDGGEYATAYQILATQDSLPEYLTATTIFLQSHIGDLRRAQGSAELLLKRHLEPRALALCKQVIGRSLLTHGDRPAEGLKHCNEARDIACAALPLGMKARYAADHATTLLHRVGINETAAEIPALRQVVLASGDALALISTHLVQAELRIKQGQLRQALRDVKTIQDLLTRKPSLILDGRRALAAAAIESLDGASSVARCLAEDALRCADRSGSITLRIPVLGTLAHILLLSGDLDGCSARLDEAFMLARPGGSALVALNDTRMQLMLARGDVKAADDKAQELHELSLGFEGGYSYYGLWHLHTRVRWLLSIGRPQEALATAEAALPHIERIGDRNLLIRMQMIAAEALGACGRPLDGVSVLATALRQNPDPALEVAAESSRVAGCLSQDNRDATLDHLRRAERIFSALGHHSSCASVRRLADTVGAVGASDGDRFKHEYAMNARSLEAAAALTYLARHAGLLGAEVISVLYSAGVSSHAALLEDDVTGERPACDNMQSTASFALTPHGTQLSLGRFSGHRFDLSVRACSSPAARCTLIAIERLVNVSLTLETMREDVRDRLTLWPEGLPDEHDGLVFSSPAMTELAKMTRRLGPSSVTVLVTGETGSGKEVVARALHRASGRGEATFIPFNCTTVPRDILDSQLFGYRKGAFTGAAHDYPGLIRGAEGGTLFLDEIGEMPLDLQPKLLRFLESCEILPIGENRPVRVDVRVIAATNADIDRLVAEGRFREDLYYRLNVVRLRIPPLRDRRQEIPVLARSMAERFARESQSDPLRLSDDTLEYMTLYDWPGNVRQLANELRRIIATMDPGALVMPEHLSSEISRIIARREVREAQDGEAAPCTDLVLSSAVENLERRMIRQAMEKSGGNIEQAAQALGLSRKGLFLKRRRLGLA